MPWVRIADDFPDHPKVVRAGPSAAWLYVCGLAYANRYATDGLIPSRQVARLADVPDAWNLAERLVEVGLWEMAEDGFQIHDYGEYQPSADDIKREREAAAKRQAEFRRRRSKAREEWRNADSNALLTRESQPPGTGPARPGKVSTKPFPPLASQDPPEGDDGAVAPTKPTSERKTSKRSSVATEPPEFLEPTETEYRLGETMGLSRGQVNLATAAMLDHWRGKGERRADWLASLRTWIRNGPRYDRPNRSAPSSQGTNGAGQPWNDESIYGKPITVEGMRT